MPTEESVILHIVEFGIPAALKAKKNDRNKDSMQVSAGLVYCTVAVEHYCLHTSKGQAV